MYFEPSEEYEEALHAKDGDGRRHPFGQEANWDDYGFHERRVEFQVLAKLQANRIPPELKLWRAIVVQNTPESFKLPRMKMELRGATKVHKEKVNIYNSICLLYTSPSPRDRG